MSRSTIIKKSIVLIYREKTPLGIDDLGAFLQISIIKLEEISENILNLTKYPSGRKENLYVDKVKGKLILFEVRTMAVGESEMIRISKARVRAL